MLVAVASKTRCIRRQLLQWRPCRKWHCATQTNSNCACRRCPHPLQPLQTQVKLRAEANILSRANGKLKAEKAADAARVAALQQELSGLQQQLAAAGSVADKLRAELAERDGVISDNYVTMQGLRRRVQELETHKFVLTYKVSAASLRR